MKSRSVSLLLAIAAALALAGCAGYTRVREIMAAPDRFEGKEVALKGKVGNTTTVAGTRAYLLHDGTGEITVVTSEALPPQDSEVALKGVVRSTVVRSNSWTLDLRVEETQRLR